MHNFFENLTSEGRQQHGRFIRNDQINVTHAFSSCVFQTDSVFFLTEKSSCLLSFSLVDERISQQAIAQLIRDPRYLRF